MSNLNGSKSDYIFFPLDLKNIDAGKALSAASRLCIGLSGSKAVMLGLFRDNRQLLSSMSFSENVPREKMSSLLIQAEPCPDGTFKMDGHSIFNLTVPIKDDSFCHASLVDPATTDSGNLEEAVIRTIRGSFILSVSMGESSVTLQADKSRSGFDKGLSGLSYALDRLRRNISDNLLVDRIALYIYTDGGLMESGLFSHIEPSLSDCCNDSNVFLELNILLKMQISVSLDSNVAPAFSTLAKFYSGMILCPVAIASNYVLIFLIDPGDSPFKQLEDFATLLQRLIRSLLLGNIRDAADIEIAAKSRFLVEALNEISLTADIPSLLEVSFSALSGILGNSSELCLLSISNGTVSCCPEFCKCTDRNSSSAGRYLAGDINVHRASAEQVVIISEKNEVSSTSLSEPPVSGVPDSGNGLNYLCYIPLMKSGATASTVYARTAADAEYSYLSAALNAISVAARSRSREISLLTQLIAERENLDGLRSLISTFSSRNVSENPVNNVANNLLSAFSKLTCAVYFKKGGDPECISVARRFNGPVGTADLSNLTADQLAPDYSDTLIFETKNSNDNQLGKLMVSIFGERIKYDNQVCIGLFQHSGKDLISLLCVISDESIQAANATASSLKPVFRAICMLENFREGISARRSIDSVNRALLEEFGKLDPQTTLYELCSTFCRLMADAFGFELAIFYHYSPAGHYKLICSYPENETGLNEEIRVEDIPASHHSTYRISQSDFLNRQITIETIAGLKQHNFKSGLLVPGPVGNNSSYPLFYLFLLGRKSPALSETGNLSIMRYAGIFGNFLFMMGSQSMKSLNFSIGADMSDLISSSFKTDGTGWKLNETDVSSRFCLLVSKVTGMSHSALYSLRKRDAVVHCISVFSSAESVDAKLINDIGKLICDVILSKDMESAGKVIQISSKDLLERPGLSRCGVSTLLILPGNKHDDDSEDVFVAFDLQRKHVSGENMEIAASIASAFSNVIESRRNAINSSLSLSALSSELRIARNVSSTFELRSILNYSCEEVTAFTSPDIVLIFLLDENGQLRLEFASGHNKNLVEESLGAGIGRWKLYGEKQNGFASVITESGGYFSFENESKCQTAISNFPDDFRSAFADIVKGDAIKSIMGAPISFAGKLLGAIVCLNISEGSFSKIDLDFIQTVSAIVSTGIENSRNFRATYDALNKLSRLDTLRSNFSSIAAHELRTPLTSIKVYIELMKMGKVGKFNETEMKNVESLLASVTELNEIITNMLEFTRMEAMLLEIEMQPISMVPLVEEVTSMISPQLDTKSIDLKVDIQEDLAKVNANYSLMKKVFHNLVSNAVKYTNPGGKIIISLKNERDGVLLSVEDTGRGITDEDMPFIFDRYYVVDASILHSGTGFRFGLPISKLIVDRHGGRIWVESKVGSGSVFHVFIPSRKEVVTEEWLSESADYLH